MAWKELSCYHLWRNVERKNAAKRNVEKNEQRRREEEEKEERRRRQDEETEARRQEREVTKLQAEAELRDDMSKKCGVQRWNRPIRG